MYIFLLFSVPLFFTIITFVLKYIMLENNKKLTGLNILFLILYYVSILLFFIGIYTHSNNFNVAIDPVDEECYSPFGGKNSLTIGLYYLLFVFAALNFWIKGFKLPPLTFVLLLSAFTISSILNIFVLFQVSEHHTFTLGYVDSASHITYFVFFPILNCIISFAFFRKLVIQKTEFIKDKTYSNAFLNACNQLALKSDKLPLIAILLSLPIFILITIILLVFGQDADAVVKVFTDTTTWRYSQQMHPPILDHKGHYLCTVAAKGKPEFVKPIFLGKRNGKTIVVNRQLQIANAFEELVSDISPKFHKLIRRFYDTYGFNLSRKINTTNSSTITYFLMKPLEWIFLIILYLCCLNPEEKIKKQYS